MGTTAAMPVPLPLLKLMSIVAGKSVYFRREFRLMFWMASIQVMRGILRAQIEGWLGCPVWRR